jgi:NitT/TauT family transport system permease protein/taurine transport system permease protein
MNSPAILPKPQAGAVAAAVPFLVVLAAWYLLSEHGKIPAYQLPSLEKTLSNGLAKIEDGTLLFHLSRSLGRLALAFLIGNAIALPLGFAIALNRHVSDIFRPVLTFLQSIAGISWVPLALIWFGIGLGPVLFVMVNTIFFSSIYNVVVGVESIPRELRRAVRTLGASRLQVYTELILPGALVQILVGLRLSMAYGFRAMVGAELIAGTDGVGYMMTKASADFATDSVILGMVAIAILWLIMDRVLFTQIERRTVIRWGMLKR